MIISKKRYKKEIEEEVAKALNKAQEQRWLDDRIERIERDRYRMSEEIARRLTALEKKCGIGTERKDETVNVPSFI